MPLPVEFLIPGIPVSGQAPGISRARWQTTVRQAAALAWGNAPLITEGKLELLVGYFHDDFGGNIDNDNMVKPIQDALIGVIYEDDRQVSDTHLIRRPMASLQVLGPPPTVAAALTAGADFIFVRVSVRTEEVDLS